ncbi:hypothetical protein [Streptomyces sp. ITFR-6]|uniref:hypothetical protein n=1 Tax=Streptomyces sp. ITFR-6 TaxID=3075197 RepID=UPI00288BC18A|nr:hypothetical protein [Streptomyces sp. ITFR-6]WNI33000.1 hypothetical protein RLT59_32530 [Streptomyces sp. ITFR-6]
MTTDWAAAKRLARGLPLREALDISCARSWVGLDLGVRVLAWESPHLLPAHAWADGRRPRWDRDAPLPSVRLRDRPPSESELALALCHPDGRIREAALGRAAGSAALLPLMIVRCADWAEPVRERARALLSREPATALPPWAGLVLLLSRRVQGRFALDLLERALSDGPAAPVEELLGGDDRATRRFAHRVALGRGLLAPERLARIAASTDDTPLQDLCADEAIASMGEEDQDTVVNTLLAARAPRVRAAGVTALRRTGRHGEARGFLADRSGPVRACARYVLRQGGVDPLPMYRALCAAPAGHPGACAGLGECGVPGDAETLWPLLGHPLPAVRLHTVVGLRALDAVTRERLTPLLDDPSSAVVRAATRALLPDASGFSREWLRDRAAADRPRPVRVAARRLLRAAGHSGPTG